MKNVILQQTEWLIMEKLWEKNPQTIMQLFHELEVNSVCAEGRGGTGGNGEPAVRKGETIKDAIYGNN